MHVATAVAALITLALVLALILLRPAPRLAATNSKVLVSRVAITIPPGEERCQGGEYIPTTAHRVRIFPSVPHGTETPPIELTFLGREGQVFSRRTVGDYAPQDALIVRIDAPSSDVARGHFCVRNRGQTEIRFAGNRTPLSPDAAIGPNNPGARATDEIRVDYFRAGHEPLWRLLPEVARRFALFKPTFVGPWVLPALFAAAFVVACGAFAATRFRRVGVGIAATAAVTVAGSSIWALMLPPFQIPDETVHAEYVQYLADTGDLPTIVPGLNSRSESVGIYDANHVITRHLTWSVEGRPTWSRFEDDQARERASQAPTSHPLGARTAATSPPLYYALDAPVARLFQGADPFDRLFAMRLLSGLLGATTAAFAFLLAREVLPHSARLWAVAGIAVGLQPVVSFMSAGVNNDNLLFAAGTALLYLFARAFRGHLTLPLAGAIGVALGVAALTKTRGLLVVPAAIVGLALLVGHAPARQRIRRVANAFVALATFAVIQGGWIIASSTVFDRVDRSTRIAGTAQRQGGNLSDLLSYVWQFFLPRLPFMEDQFSGFPEYGLWDVYIRGFVGRFGWFQYEFPIWVSWLGLAALVVLGILATRALLTHRPLVRSRRLELAWYAFAFVSLVGLLAAAGYDYRERTGFNLEQTRYLFPLIGLWGVFVAVAVKGVTVRYRDFLASAMVGAVSVHWFFSLVLTVERYYV